MEGGRGMHYPTALEEHDGSPDPVSRRLRVLHVVVQAGPTNSQWNEHCLPVADERDLIVCSLFPATVAPDPRIQRFEGDGTVGGALRVLRTALRRDRYDVVHVHAPASAALLLAACFLEGRPRNDIVFTLHNSWQNLRRRNRLLTALAFVVFPYIVCCSAAAAASIPRRVRALARHGVTVVANGVDVDRVTQALRTAPAQHQLLDSQARFTFVTVGRLIPVKDQASLLRAFARMAAIGDRLVIVGEGPLRPALEEMAAALGIRDRVRFLGLVPRDEVYRLLACSDAFISPSRGEGLPLSVLEAMAIGLPVVLSDIAPHREIVKDGSGPALVPVGDVVALSHEMRRLRETPANALSAAGARNRQCVIERFSLASMSAGYQAVYRIVATRSPRAATVRTAPPTSEGAVPMREPMDLGDVAGGIRRRLWLPGVLAVAGAILGFWASTALPAVYRSQATLLVGPTNGSVTHSSTVSASQQLATFYADMARRELVLRPVVEQLHNGMTWFDLRDDVSAIVPPQNLRLVTVTVMGASQAETQRAANLIVKNVVDLSPAPPGGNQQAFVNRQAADLEHTIGSTQAEIKQLKTQAATADRKSVV